jgi:hypothetical protein
MNCPLFHEATHPRSHFPSDAPNVPKVPGLFQEGPPVDAILVSHAHTERESARENCANQRSITQLAKSMPGFLYGIEPRGGDDVLLRSPVSRHS